MDPNLVFVAGIAVFALYRASRLGWIIQRWFPARGYVVGYVGWYAVVEYDAGTGVRFVTHLPIEPSNKPLLGSVYTVRFNPSTPQSSVVITLGHDAEPILWAGSAFLLYKVVAN